MHYTKHAQIRLAQRGISKSMISAVMDYGSRDHERKRWTLGRQQAEKAIAFLQEEIRCLKRIQDKGGLTIVETDSNILTAWCN